MIMMNIFRKAILHCSTIYSQYHDNTYSLSCLIVELACHINSSSHVFDCKCTSEVATSDFVTDP